VILFRRRNGEHVTVCLGLVTFLSSCNVSLVNETSEGGQKVFLYNGPVFR
jgi:hypothetical protein